MTSIPAKILSHARAGNPVRAWRLFGELGLLGVSDDIKTLTLKGRLLKDLAWRALGDERSAFMRRASEAYCAAHALKPDSYPLINAAALALFAGDPAQSRELALQVLQLIEGDPDEGETPYWREATRAEALLLLDEPAEADAALSVGIAALPQAWEDHARTIQQFEAIIDAQGGNAEWLDKHRPPCSVHFSGLIGLDPSAEGLRDTIDRTMVELKPGFAFGALAAGADILIAEAACRAGARLHITLPNSIDQFRASSVEPFGADWVARYDTLIEQAERVDQLWPDLEEQGYPLWVAIEMATLVSMGQAIRNADVLSSVAHAVTITAPGEKERAPAELWQASGKPFHWIETARHSLGLSGDASAVKVDDTIAMQGLIKLRGGGAADLENAVRSFDLSRVEGADEAVFCGSPANCLAAIEHFASVGNDFAGAILVTGGSDLPLLEAQLDQIILLDRAAEAGQFLTNAESAMIALLLKPDLCVEEFGEVTSLRGPIGLWLINPTMG
ncbi:MAG: tetratricopeptide repeat-containing protein [Pseudomonadota bacterium]